MDGLAAGRHRRGDDGLDVEVALCRGRRADADGAVGEAHVHRVLVGGRVHGHGLDAELVQRANDAHGDLASVGYEDPGEHARV